jgi:hypothetical protein
MTAHPDAEPGDGELWVREGEMYALDRDKLFALTGAVAIFPYEGEVWAFVPGLGKITLSYLMTPRLQVVK